MTADRRVVHVITKLDVGGAQEIAIRLCAGQRQRGWDALLVAGADPGTGGDGWGRAHGAGVPTRPVASLVRRIDPRHDLGAVRDLARLFRELRPAVVHTHSSKAGFVGRLAARWANVPVVVHTVHGWSFRDHDRAAARAAYVLAERVAARAATAIVVVSEADRRSAARHRIGGRRPGLVTLVPNGVVDGVAVTVPPPPRLSGPPVVGTVTRLGPPKDTETLIRAFAAIRTAHPDAELHIVGDGPDRSRLTALAARLTPPGAVRFLGTRDDVADLLRTFTVFALSSRSEGLPLALIEAMAAGVPVVASDVGGIPEIVGGGHCGVVVAAGDHEALARAIASLLADHEGAAKVGQAGAERALDFSAPAMLDRYDALYEECLERCASCS